jgi:hypothetical protein
MTFYNNHDKLMQVLVKKVFFILNYNLKYLTVYKILKVNIEKNNIYNVQNLHNTIDIYLSYQLEFF